MMDITVQQKNCDALAGLFQHIVTDLRVRVWPCIAQQLAVSPFCNVFIFNSVFCPRPFVNGNDSSVIKGL